MGPLPVRIVPFPDSVPPRTSTYCALSVPFCNCTLPPVSTFAPAKVVSVAPLVIRTFIVAVLVPETFSSQTVESAETTASCALPVILRTFAIQRTAGEPAVVQLLELPQLALAVEFDQL